MNKIFCAILAIALSACHSPILQPVESLGCGVESAITEGFGSEVVSQCGGTDPAACGQAFQAALGNVNLCAAPLPAPPAQLTQSFVSGWKKVGDVPKEALKSSGMKAQAFTTQGIVGSIACPIAINTVLGLLTGVIPKACGCTKNLSASQLGDALGAACVATVPI